MGSLLVRQEQPFSCLAKGYWSEMGGVPMGLAISFVLEYGILNKINVCVFNPPFLCCVTSQNEPALPKEGHDLLCC